MVKRPLEVWSVVGSIPLGISLELFLVPANIQKPWYVLHAFCLRDGAYGYLYKKIRSIAANRMESLIRWRPRVSSLDMCGP